MNFRKESSKFPTPELAYTSSRPGSLEVRIAADHHVKLEGIDVLGCLGIHQAQHGVDVDIAILLDGTHHQEDFRCRKPYQRDVKLIDQSSTAQFLALEPLLVRFL